MRSRLSLAVLGLLVSGTALAVEEPSIAVVAERRTVYVGERVEIDLVLELDAELVAESLVPLLRRRLDLPVRVEAPWVEDGDVLRPIAGVATTDGPTLALNDSVVHAETTGDGRHRLRMRFETERAGEVPLVPTRLRYAVTSRFERDAFGDRVPVDRIERRVDAEPVHLRVLQPPERGRPEDFSGATGAVSLDTRIEDDDGAAVLVVELSGDTDLASVVPPYWPDDAPRVLGTLDEYDGRTRVLRHELAQGTHRVPPLRWVVFDTSDEPAYRVLEGREWIVPGTEPPPTEPPAAAATDAAVGGVTATEIALWLTPVVLLLGLVLRFLTRRRERAAVDPDTERLDALLERHLARGERDVGESFIEFVADWQGWRPAAVVSPDLAGRLSAQGVPDDLARETAARVEAIVNRRYDVVASATDPAPELDDLARRLHAASVQLRQS